MRNYIHVQSPERWQQLRADLRSRLSGSPTDQQVRVVFSSLFRELGDRHSSFVQSNITLPPREKRNWFATDFISQSAIVRLNGIDATDFPTKKRFADSLYAALRQLDLLSPRRWIIDLRNDRGGSTDARLAAFGTLMKNSRQLAFVNNSDRRFTYSFDKGVQTVEGYRSYSTVRWLDSYTMLVHDRVPIYVIIGPLTASAGEHLAIAFRGNKNTILVGEPTSGYSSGIQLYTLSNGSQLALAVTLPMLRGKKLIGKLSPDRPIPQGLDPVAHLATGSLDQR